MNKNDKIKETVKDALDSSQIPELEKKAIIEKLEEALNSNLIADSEKEKIVEIKKELSSSSNENQVLKILTRLIELLIVFTKTFLG